MSIDAPYFHGIAVTSITAGPRGLTLWVHSEPSGNTRAYQPDQARQLLHRSSSGTLRNELIDALTLCRELDPPRAPVRFPATTWTRDRLGRR